MATIVPFIAETPSPFDIGVKSAVPVGVAQALGSDGAFLT